MDWNRLPLLNYQQMVSSITQIHIKHMRHSPSPRPARAYLDARQEESLKCNSSERISTARKFAAAAPMIRLTESRLQRGQLTNAATHWQCADKDPFCLALVQFLEVPCFLQIARHCSRLKERALGFGCFELLLPNRRPFRPALAMRSPEARPRRELSY